MIEDQNQYEKFKAFARESAEKVGLPASRAEASLDERRDGDAVCRVLLVVPDPIDDTWDVDQVRRLRFALGRKATELGLPGVSLTLLAESEAAQPG